MSAARDHVILKGAHFYRPGRRGYTSHVCAAGLYTREEARAEAANEPEIRAAWLGEYMDELLTESKLVNEKLRALGFVVEDAVDLPQKVAERAGKKFEEGAP